MKEDEIPLSGGNLTGVVRIAQSVRRATGSWSATVHTLLLHLEACGFASAPRFLGLDERGREILSFIEGEVGHYPLRPALWSEAALVAVSHLLRRYHDATLSYLPPTDACWQFVYPDFRRHEVICHGDVAPYNLVYSDDRPEALIDFDTAGPGPRIWDLAYAAYCFVPLSRGQEMLALDQADPARRGPRLRLFCEQYGLEDPYATILDFVEMRLETMCRWLSEGVAAGDSARQRIVADGGLDYYRSDIRAFQGDRSHLLPYLL